MRHYFTYALLIAITLFFGLASRYEALFLPTFLKMYLGDTLWALMVYWGFRFFMKNRKPFTALLAALIFAYLIETSQLYQGDWAKALREYKIVALIFGHGFLWSDVLCYTVGAALGFLLDRVFIRNIY